MKKTVLLLAFILILSCCPVTALAGDTNLGDWGSVEEGVEDWGPIGDFDIEDGILYEYTGDGGTVVIPGEVVEIDHYAFHNCTKVKKVTIPAGVTGIGDAVFKGCTGLKEITFKGKTVPTIGTDIFAGATTLITVYVPASAYDGYVTALTPLLPEGVTIVAVDTRTPRCTFGTDKAEIVGDLLGEYAEQQKQLFMAAYDGNGRMLTVTDVVTEHVNGSYAMAVEAEEIAEVQLFALDGSFVPVATFEPFK